jgi:hypothetical protein
VESGPLRALALAAPPVGWCCRGRHRVEAYRGRLGAGITGGGRSLGAGHGVE